MHLFHNDYNRTAHPAVLKKLMETEATHKENFAKIYELLRQQYFTQQ